MYIKVKNVCGLWDYSVYAANHKRVLRADNLWADVSDCIRAAKKMARHLGIEYRGVK